MLGCRFIMPQQQTFARSDGVFLGMQLLISSSDLKFIMQQQQSFYVLLADKTYQSVVNHIISFLQQQ
ncbi:hypothetical protein ABKV19_018609 [Rosa sericea]